MDIVNTVENQNPIESTPDELFEGEPFIKTTTFSGG